MPQGFRRLWIQCNAVCVDVFGLHFSNADLVFFFPEGLRQTEMQEHGGDFKEMEHFDCCYPTAI